MAAAQVRTRSAPVGEAAHTKPEPNSPVQDRRFTATKPRTNALSAPAWPLTPLVVVPDADGLTFELQGLDVSGNKRTMLVPDARDGTDFCFLVKGAAPVKTKKKTAQALSMTLQIVDKEFAKFFSVYRSNVLEAASSKPAQPPKSRVVRGAAALKDDARVCESPKPAKQDRSLDVVSGNESKRVHTEPLPKDAPSSKPVLRLGTNALKFVRQCLEDLMPVLRKGDAPEQRTKAAQIIMEGIVREPVLSEFQAEVWHMICGYVNNVVKGRFAIVVHQAIVVPMWKRITSGDVSCPELPLASFMRPVNNQTIIRKRSVDALIVKHFPILRSTRGGELLGLAGPFYEASGLPSETVFPYDVSRVQGLYKPGKSVVALHSFAVSTPYPLDARPGLFMPGRLSSAVVEAWSMDRAVDAFAQPYKPTTPEDVMAGILSLLTSSLVFPKTKPGTESYAARAREMRNALYSARGASFKDWDDVLKGRVGWEVYMWAQIFYLATERERKQHRAALVAVQPSGEGAALGHAADEAKKAVNAFDEVTSTWIMNARMLAPVIAMIKLRKTEPWYETKVFMKARTAARTDAPDDDDIAVNQTVDDCVMDMDFYV